MLLLATGNRPALTSTVEWYWHVHPSRWAGRCGRRRRRFRKEMAIRQCRARYVRYMLAQWPPRPPHIRCMTPRHCRRENLNPLQLEVELQDELIGLCRPSELKFSNLLAVQCSSTPLDSSAAPSITPRSTVRPELQSEGHCRQRIHVISEGKIIPVGLADVGSLPPLLARHVRPRYCAVQ